MRCRFASTTDPAERRELESFDARCQTFFERLLLDTEAAELGTELARVHPEFELLGVGRSGDRVELDVRAEVAWRPWLWRFRGRCPNAVKLTVERDCQPIEQVCDGVRSSTGLDVQNARVRAGLTRGHLLELVVYLQGAQGVHDTRAQQAAEALVEGCLGERIVEDWVQAIDVAPLPRAGPLQVLQPSMGGMPGFGIQQLQAAVERAVQGVWQSLPEQPLVLLPPSDDWVLFELDRAREGGPAQSDLLFASTCVPELLKCYLQDAPFSSLRFSRHAERFLYLKYRADGPLKERVGRRQLVEDVLDRSLRQRRLGCVVGNGVGRGHSYVDLAVLDVEASLCVVQQLASEAQLPRHSWLLFCDSEWRHEWVGVWPNSPPPASGD